MTSSTKVLFLEVDAGDKVLIQRWAAAGILPNFRSLLANGMVGDTMSLRGFFVGSTWPSLYTGVTPARHGIHSLVQLRPGTYEYYRCYTGDHVKREPFWNYLSRAGRRVAVLDVPLSGITEGLTGIQIVEWGSHDSNYGFSTWPPSLEREVKDLFGLHPAAGSCNANDRSPRDFAEFRDRLVRGVQRKAELTKYYLNKGGWDLFAQVFTESHCVGHQCWHLHDPGHPGHDPEFVAAAGDPIRDVYVAIDGAIGEILTEVDGDTTVIVLAGHRMAHKFGAGFLLPEILIRLGVAVPSQDPAATSVRAVDRLDATLTWHWQRVPPGLKRYLQPLRKQLRAWIDGYERPVLPRPLRRLDLKNGKCFLLDNGFPVAGIRVNLAGREPNGVVTPGPEMDAFFERLAQDLLDIRDADTGRPIVDQVIRTADLYRGEHLDHLPDILVEWSDHTPLGSSTAGNPGGSRVRLESKKIGLIEGTNVYCRTGDHRPEGLFMALGPGIVPGRLGRTVSIMDFAPTLTRLLGVELPDVDGEPIGEIVHARDTISGPARTTGLDGQDASTTSPPDATTGRRFSDPGADEGLAR